MKLEKSEVPNWYINLSSSWSTAHVEATQWSNGDGVKLEVYSENSLGVRQMDLTWEEVEAITMIYTDTVEEGL